MYNDHRTVTESGILFGPNASGRTYLSVFTHRGSRPQKNRWSPDVPPPMEYRIFCAADRGNWQCYRGHYWGLHDGGKTVLGYCGERLCKFPCPSNDSDPWHGYPVSPMADGDRDTPPDELVEHWIQTRVITRLLQRPVRAKNVNNSR